MTLDRSRTLLRQNLAELAAARGHLDYSYRRVTALPPDLKEVQGEQLESAEAFTSRFARAVDLLVNKVLRSLDRVELRPEGTLLDVVNAAEKRGLVPQADLLREMKGVRNVIAHDYAGVQLPEIFDYCRAQKPGFDEICTRVEAYVRQLGE
jgi:uncharacterized protein YutE (UPF0331/DUF86 family)